MMVRIVAAACLLSGLVSGTALAQSAVTNADIKQAKAEIELLKQDLQLKEAQLRVLELQMARQSSTPAAVVKPANKPAVKNAPAPAPAAVPVVAAAPEAMEPAPRHSAVDPAPYEASIKGRTTLFRATASSKWLALDEKRLVYWVVDDEAYLLNLTQTCPGLLDTKRLRLENFSTKVRAGIDNVVFDDQYCLIGSIQQLGGRSLPKPPHR